MHIYKVWGFEILFCMCIFYNVMTIDRCIGKYSLIPKVRLMHTKLFIIQTIFCLTCVQPGLGQVNFSDSSSLKRSVEKFIEYKWQHKDIELDTAIVFGVRDNEYWQTDENGALTIHDKVKELSNYKPDTAFANFNISFNKETDLNTNIDELHIRTIAENVIIANYKLVGHLIINNEPCTKMFRVTEVDKLNGDNWQTLTYHETIVIGMPIRYPAVKKNLYKNYVGEYRLTSFATYEVLLEGDKLMMAIHNALRPKRVFRAELIPEDDHTFVSDNRYFYYRMRFDCNKNGVAKSLRIIEYSGVEYSLSKINK
jgi:hypothetical protein